MRPPIGACQIPVTMRFIEARPSSRDTRTRSRDRRRACGWEMSSRRSTGSPFRSGREMDALLRRVESADPITRYRAIDDPRGLRRDDGPCDERPRGAGIKTDTRTGIGGELDGRTHARSSGRNVPETVPGCRLSEALVRAGVAGCHLHRLGRRHQRTGHRYSELSVGVRRVCAGIAPGRSRHGVRTVYARRSGQSRRLPLESSGLAPAGRTEVHGEDRDSRGRVVAKPVRYTTMAFRSAPNATVVGSTTAGADGNVSAIPLPGGLRSRSAGSACSIPTRDQRSGSVSSPTSKRHRRFKAFAAAATKCSKRRCARYSVPKRRRPKSSGWRNSRARTATPSPSYAPLRDCYNGDRAIANRTHKLGTRRRRRAGALSFRAIVQSSY